MWSKESKALTVGGVIACRTLHCQHNALNALPGELFIRSVQHSALQKGSGMHEVHSRESWKTLLSFPVSQEDLQAIAFSFSSILR